MSVKSKYLQKVMVMITGIYLLAIWGHSMLPADISTAESTYLLDRIREVLFAIGIHEDSAALFTEYMLRKSAHFLEYSGLMICYCCIMFGRCANQNGQITKASMILGWIVFWISVPLIDETIQLFTPGRMGQITDIWLDMAGGFVGTLLAIGMHKLFKHKRARIPVRSANK